MAIDLALAPSLRAKGGHRIRASGAGIDLEHAAEDRRRVQCPTLVVWGEHGTVGRLYDVMKIWREHAST